MPATPEEERALEEQELESFRRRREWMEQVIGSDAGEDEERRDERSD